MITKDTLFAPPRKPQTKADMTNTAARAIIDSESALRVAKIEKLRQARLEMEAQQPVVTKKPRAKAATRQVRF
ncbi:hypothetical protein KKP04_10525 [Rhodomicrobium sp. Az07]|uniref:hypothetical protein n=1 Tax=Rhodomicrobium sp. Az07 TaxID=2839034 RepID=UPI001BE7DA71|nr:hypothetical protein [Rhodomicrobium sp. Az07]MBT3071304.1 hypothetical protein [Rhodomicrobium sp. Az07]